MIEGEIYYLEPSNVPVVNYLYFREDASTPLQSLLTPPKKNKIVREEVKGTLEAEIISTSVSVPSCPMVIEAKKDEIPCFCVESN